MSRFLFLFALMMAMSVSSHVTANVAIKLAQLDSALRKYQVEGAKCEMFIASQVHRLEENGPLAKIVYEIFR